MARCFNYGQRQSTRLIIMNDDVEKTLADPKHPIWKVMLGLVAVLSALWINGN